MDMGKPMSTVYVPDEYGRLVPTQVPTCIGFIGLYAGPEPPEGYLYCDGSAIGRETYSELFEAVGTLYGAGDGAETFNLPDARGVFFRGDGGENSAAMGVRQGDAIREIYGSLSSVYNATTDGSDDGALEWVSVSTGAAQVTDARQGRVGIKFKASNYVPTALEVRPINLAMKPCIRYA